MVCFGFYYFATDQEKSFCAWIYDLWICIKAIVCTSPMDYSSFSFKIHSHPWKLSECLSWIWKFWGIKSLVILNQAVAGYNDTCLPGGFAFQVVNICDAVWNDTMVGALKMFPITPEGLINSCYCWELPKFSSWDVCCVNSVRGFIDIFLDINETTVALLLRE